MRLRQLGDLRADVRKRADVVNYTTAIPDTDINEVINQGWARVYGKLARTGEDYYRQAFLWTTVPSQDTYYTTDAGGVPAGTNVLPPDLWLVRGMDCQIQSNFWVPMVRFQNDERDDYQSADWSWPSRPMYLYSGSGATASIQLMPPPSGAVPMKTLYIPACPRMVSDTDTIDGGNGWEVYAIDWAARRIAERDENYELCGRLDGALAEMDRAIDAEAATRNAGQAPKMRRTRYKSGMLWRPGRW